jgi:hypothetical protein
MPASVAAKCSGSLQLPASKVYVFSVSITFDNLT